MGIFAYEDFMKNHPLIWGIIIILLVLVGGTYIGTMHLKAKEEGKECRKFTDDFILAIAQDWDTTELIKRASPELLGSIPQEKLDELADTMRRLGKLKKYSGSVGGPVVHTPKETDKVIYARLLADAEFDAGAKRFLIDLVRHGDKWQIYSFHIETKPPSQ
jgi:hypothetical protein